MAVLFRVHDGHKQVIGLTVCPKTTARLEKDVISANKLGIGKNVPKSDATIRISIIQLGTHKASLPGECQNSKSDFIRGNSHPTKHHTWSSGRVHVSILPTKSILINRKLSSRLIVKLQRWFYVKALAKDFCNSELTWLKIE
jgi:hypothetical protein